MERIPRIVLEIVLLIDISFPWESCDSLTSVIGHLASCPSDCVGSGCISSPIQRLIPHILLQVVLFPIQNCVWLCKVRQKALTAHYVLVILRANTSWSVKLTEILTGDLCMVGYLLLIACSSIQ